MFCVWKSSSLAYKEVHASAITHKKQLITMYF